MNKKINIKEEDILFAVLFVLSVVGMVLCGGCILGSIWVAIHGYGINWFCILASSLFFVFFSKTYSDLMGE